MRCPGYDEADVRLTSSDEHVRLAAEGTAREWHMSGNHPHLFCGCGSETEQCHPGRCCENDDWGTCRNCGREAPEPEPTPEVELSDPLFEILTGGT